MYMRVNRFDEVEEARNFEVFGIGAVERFGQTPTELVQYRNGVTTRKLRKRCNQLAHFLARVGSDAGVDPARGEVARLDDIFHHGGTKSRLYVVQKLRKHDALHEEPSGRRISQKRLRNCYPDCSGLNDEMRFSILSWF